MRHVTKTDRTAQFADHVEAVYEARNDDGLFAGVVYELTDSELTEAEQTALWLNEQESRAGVQ